jgi:hypothetical protein
MPEQKKVNHWKQGDYKHLTTGRVLGMLQEDMKLKIWWRREQRRTVK